MAKRWIEKRKDDEISISFSVKREIKDRTKEILVKHINKQEFGVKVPITQAYQLLVEKAMLDFISNFDKGLIMTVSDFNKFVRGE